MDESVVLSLFDVVIAGLPYSGKSTLLQTIFETRSPRRTSGLALYEVMLRRDRWTDESCWVETSKLQAEVHTMFLAFAHFFARQKRFPQLDSKGSKFEIFSDPEVQSCFDETFSCLEQLLAELNSGEQVEKVLLSLLGLSNVYDIGVSKAAYEFLTVVGGGNNMLFVNVLDISKFDSKSILKPLNLQDTSYRGRYNASQASTFGNQDPLHYLIDLVEVAARYRNTNTLFVGTHADLLDSSTREKRTKELMEQIKACGDDFGVEGSTYLPMITVDATNQVECKEINEGLIQLLNRNNSFEVCVSMRYIFLRYVLSCTGKPFMHRDELNMYAKYCGINTDEDVEKFLLLFRSCGSIVYYKDKDKFLNSHIILLPIEFLRELERLYRVQSEPNLTEEVKACTQRGIVCDEVLRTLWKKSEDANFYVSALENLGLLTKLNHTRNGKDIYFIPSMRLQHYTSSPANDSLIIKSDASLIPFSSKQCHFVQHFLKKYKENMKLDENCPFYNCLAFLWKNNVGEAKIMIRFFRCHIEISIVDSNDQLLNALYSMLKTDCVAIMNTLKPILRFDLCIVCPNRHFIPFTACDTDVEALECGSCKRMIGVTDSNWVKAAYRGSRKSASCSEGTMIAHSVNSLCDTVSCSLLKVCFKIQ